MERTLTVKDTFGDSVNVLLSLPGEEMGDRTGERRLSDFSDETIVQFYEGRSPAKPLGRLLMTTTPKTLSRVKAELSLNGPNKLEPETVHEVVRWAQEQERREQSFQTARPRLFTPRRPSALSERLALA